MPLILRDEMESRRVILRGYNSLPYQPICKSPVKQGILIPFFQLEVRLGQKICRKCAMESFMNGIQIPSN